MTPTPANPAWTFQRLRWRVFRNAGTRLIAGSRLRLVTVVLSSLIVAAAAFAISFAGFHLLATYRIPYAGGIVGILFDLLFLALGVLLFFSTGIIVFGSLFGSPEAAFLLAGPARADHVFAYKFQSAVAFSSWAFVLLGLPILVAYGLVNAVSWHFFVLLPAFLLGYVLLPGALGSLACLLVANYVPQRRRQVLVAAGVLVGLLLAWWGFSTIRYARSFTNRDALQDLLGQFEFARSELAPNHWMARGLQAAARGDLAEAAMPLGLVWANGLFAYLLATWAAKRLYRRGYNRMATGGELRRRYGGGWADRTAIRLLGFLDPQTRLLIVKDLRTFRRDPKQWTQILIFAGLIGLYVTNSPQFYSAEVRGSFQHGVSLMNVAATAMLMCAYMGRFIYPMISLEGRKFWILGLLPLSRDRLLWGKFAFAASGAMLVAIPLVVISDLLLGVGLVAVLLHIVAVAVLALGMSGLSVGFGAWLPNFKETDPSKIAVGFGGTLNLVVGLLYLLTIVGTIAGPYHLLAATADERLGISAGGFVLVGVGVLFGLAVGTLAVMVPLRVGMKSLREMEF